MPRYQRLAVERKLANAEKVGNADQVKRLKARLKDFPEVEAQHGAVEPVSKSNKKAEILEAAKAAGVDADESMTKDELLEALEG